MKNGLLTLLVFSTVFTQSCIVVGGYSSTDGWFIWPGGLMISLLVLIMLFLLFRRRR